MALKYRIKKDEFEKLDENKKALYAEKGDGYVLDVEGADDGEELRRALENERENGRSKGQKAAQLEEQLAELKREQSRKNGNIEDIEKDYRRQLQEKENAYKEQIGAMQKRIESGLIDSHVSEITKISSSPKLMAPHVRDRLSVEWENEEPRLVIKDAQGKASSLTAEDLQKEFANSEDFSAIIIGSKGSGGGGAPNGPTGVGGPVGQDRQQPQKKLSEMSPQELAAHAKANYSDEAED